MVLDVDKVWEATEKDPKFQEEIPAGAPRQVLRGLVEALPAILADQLEKQLTIKSLLNAKLSVLKYCIENKFIQKMMASYPDDAFGFLSREDIAEGSQSIFEELVPAIEAIVAKVPEWLKENGLSDEDALTHPKAGGLSQQAINEYRAGTLTVGRLLEIQPAAIIFNKS